MLITREQTQHYSSFDEFIDSLADQQLVYYASDLLAQHACHTMQELGMAIKRATEVCHTLHLPLRENFKVVFRSSNGEVVQDWRLSPTAYLLLVLNADSHNDIVARAQLEMVRRVLKQQ